MKYLLVIFMLTNQGEAYVTPWNSLPYDSLSDCEVAGSNILEDRHFGHGTFRVPLPVAATPTCIVIAANIGPDGKWE
jgi:hypothetical protein